MQAYSFRRFQSFFRVLAILYAVFFTAALNAETPAVGAKAFDITLLTLPAKASRCRRNYAGTS